MALLKPLEDSQLPNDSLPIVEEAKGRYGMVPNLTRVLATSPAAVESYARLAGAFEKSLLSPTERQVITMTANFENECHYCMAAHTAISQAQGIDKHVIDALRAGTPIQDKKLEALRQYTLAMLNQRGWVSDEQTQSFLDAGYEHAHVLEVIVGLALKTISNYTNHVADTPVDCAFKGFAWHKPETTNNPEVTNQEVA